MISRGSEQMKIGIANYVNQRDGVGGDLFTVSPLSSGGLRLVGTDACGHGRAAYPHRRTLERRLLEAIDQSRPSSVLAELNETAVDQQGMATATLCDLEPVSATSVRVHVANAGHWSPIAVLGDGEVVECHGRRQAESQLSDVMLGVDSDTAFSDGTVELLNPLAMLLYSDGLVELEIRQRGTSELYTLDRLKSDFRDVVMESPRDNAWNLLTALRERLNQARKAATPTDDLSFTAITFRPAGE